MKTYIVDIDGTICKTDGNNYKNSVPIQENIDKINKLYDEGEFIIYWTSRGNSTNMNLLILTENQLYQWGCKHNSLRMGKPSYDVWVDDKSLQIEEL